jgi:hypothetical protein
MTYRAPVASAKIEGCGCIVKSPGSLRQASLSRVMTPKWRFCRNPGRSLRRFAANAVPPRADAGHEIVVAVDHVDRLA